MTWIERITLQNAAVATGNGATIQLSNLGGVLIAISGTFTATVSFEARGPDGTYYSVLGTKLSDGTTGTSTTTTGLWFFQLPGVSLFRTPVTWTSGTSVTVIASSCPAYSPITSAILSTGDLEIGAVEVKDGAADIRQTVLAASTAAAATDKAAVVALHPSSSAMGAGASSATTLRAILASNSPGSAELTNFGAGEYETVAASQTAQVLGATGAIGDYVSGLLIIPATTSPGQVLLVDNATSITIFVGVARSVGTLIPFFIPLGLKSVSGAWKVTTGADVSVVGIGNFS